MKKTLTVIAAAFFAVGGFAQTTIWKADDSQNVGDKPDAWWDRSNPAIAEQDGQKCLVFTSYKEGKPDGIADFEKNNIAMGFTSLTDKRVSMMVKKSTEGNIRVVLEYDGGEQELAAYYGQPVNEWKRLVFDFSSIAGATETPKAIRVYSHVESANDIESEQVYLNDLRMEEPAKVDGKAVEEWADGEMNGNIACTGAWMKGECSNVRDSWNKVYYDDFVSAASKIGNNLTSVDLRQAVLKDASNIFLTDGKNPNCLIYTTGETLGMSNNVIANGVAENVYLFDGHGYDFNCPENFIARNITYQRNFEDNNWYSMVLPFTIWGIKNGEQELSSENYTIELFNSIKECYVNFEETDNLLANIPVLFKSEAITGEMTFCGGEQEIVATSKVDFSKELKGAYAKQSGQGKYVLDENGEKFVVGMDGSMISAFRAYLELPENGRALMIRHGFDPTGLATAVQNQEDVVYGGRGTICYKSGKAQTVKVYGVDGSLRRLAELTEGMNVIDGLVQGLYIVNGKKVSVN